MAMENAIFHTFWCKTKIQSSLVFLVWGNNFFNVFYWSQLVTEEGMPVILRHSRLEYWALLPKYILPQLSEMHGTGRVKKIISSSSCDFKTSKLIFTGWTSQFTFWKNIVQRGQLLYKILIINYFQSKFDLNS